MRDAKIMQLYEGTSQIQRLVIAKEVLLPRQRRRRSGAGRQGRRPPSRASPSRQPLRSRPWTPPNAPLRERRRVRRLRRSSHAAWEPPRADRADPVAILERQARTPGPRAGADPLRADGRLALRLLPRRRRGDGRRPRRRRRSPGCGCRPAATPTSPTSAPSPRPTAASSSTSTTSTRPCRGPGSGTSSGSPPASRSPAAKAASSASSAAPRCSTGGAQPTARRCAPSPRQSNLEVWYARLDVEAVLARGRGATTRREVKRVAQGRRQGARQGQPAGAREAHPRRSTASCASSANRRCSSRSRSWSPTGEGRDLERGAAGRCSTPTATSLPADRQHLLDGYRFRHIARKVVGVGSVGTRAWVVLLHRRRRRRPALPAGEGGRGLGAGALRRRQPLPQPRPAGGRGPAADAGGQRHLPRLVPGGRASTAASATSTCASSGTGSARPRSSG